MPYRAKATPVDAMFSALSNPTRRDILDLLLRGEQTVQVIAEHFDMARPSVSEHLKVLKDADLVAEEQRGRHRYYSLTAEPLRELRSWLNPYERFWRGRLTELGQVLDDLAEDEPAEGQLEKGHSDDPDESRPDSSSPPQRGAARER